MDIIQLLCNYFTKTNKFHPHLNSIKESNVFFMKILTESESETRYITGRISKINEKAFLFI